VSAPREAPRRKLWLDWQRGLAVLFMIEVHVLDAWLAPGTGRGPARDALLMIGGLAAPGFLYMAGLSQSLADASLARRGLSAADRRARALRRALWLLGVAYGFRVVEFVVGGAFLRTGGWGDLLRVDILNIIGLGLAASALLAAGRPRLTGALLAGAAALLVVVVTPGVADVLRHYDLPRPGQPVDPAARAASSQVVDVLLAYAYGSYPRANFSLLNWSAFLFAGVAAGRLSGSGSRPWRWLAVGACLIGAGWLVHHGPVLFTYQNFWRTSPAWFAVRLGACAGLTGLLQLVPVAAERPLQWLSTLGRQSLVAYIASVELTYGALAYPFRRRLTLGETVLGMFAMAAITWAVSAGWERLQARRRQGADAGCATTGPANTSG
jgi:hypothetical protein